MEFILGDPDTHEYFELQLWFLYPNVLNITSQWHTLNGNLEKMQRTFLGVFAFTISICIASFAVCACGQYVEAESSNHAEPQELTSFVGIPQIIKRQLDGTDVTIQSHLHGRTASTKPRIGENIPSTTLGHISGKLGVLGREKQTVTNSSTEADRIQARSCGERFAVKEHCCHGKPLILLQCSKKPCFFSC